MFHWLTERRRRHILGHPFPPAWEQILDHNVAAYRRLDDAERRRLRELVQVFVVEKHWEGCGGLELTDEIRVTIAGQACLLILGRDHWLFSAVESILVYPSTVVTPERPAVFSVATEPVQWHADHRPGVPRRSVI
jgi:Mlc titration factor MtfA (ptsG expression regulator)